MTEQPDLNQLAARYLDLWQEQVAQLANDPALAEMMAKSYDLIRNVTSPIASEAARSAAAAFSPVGAGQQPAHLADRVAALEKRVGELEAALQLAGGRAPKSGQKSGRKRVSPRPK